ncbi:MAG: LysR family transcriptional regulator [Microbacteriaceae bacterium]
MIDFRQLQALSAVHEHGSIAAAARALHWSQPTVSHHLAGLEAALGTPVTERLSSGTNLTAAGMVVRDGALEVLAIVDRIERTVKETAGHRTPIRLGAIPTIGASIIPPALAQLAGQGITVSMREDEIADLEKELRGRQLDAAVVVGSPELTHKYGPRLRTLFTERLYVAVPATHPAAQRASVALTDLADEYWVLGTTDTDPVDDALIAAAAERGMQIASRIRSDDYSVILGYVAAGLGISLVPESALQHGRSDVRAVTLTDAGFTREIAIIVGQHAPVGSMSAVIEALLDSVRDLSGMRRNTR